MFSDTAPARPESPHLNQQHLHAGRFVWHYIAQRRGGFATLAATVVLAAGCAVGVQYQIKRLVDTMTEPARSGAQVWLVLGTFIGLIAAESVFWRVSGWLTCRTTVRAGVQMRLDLFQHLSGHSLRYFADHLSGSLGQRITGTAGAFGVLTNTAVWRVAPPLIDFLGAIVVFSTIDVHMALTAAVYVILATAGLVVVGKKGRPLHAAYYGEQSTVAGQLTDAISNMWAVKAFSARQREWERLRGQFEQEAGFQRGSWMYTERTRAGYDVAVWIMASVMLCWAVSEWEKGGISPGAVVVIGTLTFRILHGSRDVAIAAVDMFQQLAYIEDTIGAIGEVHSIADRPGAPALIPGKGAVEFRDVSFSYEGNHPVLRHVDLRIEAGEKVGIVGFSGAGKTTVVNLIQRLYEPQAGEVLLDGQCVRSVTQDSLRAVLAVVPQEIMLFHRTVMENIRFGRPDAPPAEIYRAAKAAHCESFVSRLPQGYDTLLGERGVKLSGGQRQRIGIARALLKDAPVLILDEATSALDTESELHVHRNIVELLSGRTVVAVAHRLSTLAAFDRILVIHQGKILEEGTPAELRRRGTLFARMWRLQAEGLSVSAVEDAERNPPHHDRVAGGGS
ncbi:MAG: ABC-type multidrug transport system, ATPase and permease component [Gammaproteobacteria bacterium]|nr:ABC-type multidrug transport system, ATPase and permease component [Gammaproteobacteria bacterium]